jgi:hypothetical protein
MNKDQLNISSSNNSNLNESETAFLASLKQMLSEAPDNVFNTPKYFGAKNDFISSQ